MTSRGSRSFTAFAAFVVLACACSRTPSERTPAPSAKASAAPSASTAKLAEVGLEAGAQATQATKDDEDEDNDKSVDKNKIDLNEFEMATATAGWGLTNPSQIAKTTDGARTWSIAAPAEKTEKMLRLFVRDSNHVIGLSQVGAPDEFTVVVTNDGGKAWAVGRVKNPRRATPMSAWCSFLAERAFLVIDSEHIMNTTGGDLFTAKPPYQAWTHVTALPAHGPIAMTSETKGWLVGRRGNTGLRSLYRTADAGKAWTKVELPASPSNEADAESPGGPGSLDVIGAPMIFGERVVVVAVDGAAQTIRYVSTNGGQSFVAKEVIKESEADFAFKMKDHAAALVEVGDTYTLWGNLEADASSKVRIKIADSVPSGELAAPRFVSTTIGFALLRPDYEKRPTRVLVTRDAGLTWKDAKE